MMRVNSQTAVVGYHKTNKHLELKKTTETFIISFLSTLFGALPILLEYSNIFLSAFSAGIGAVLGLQLVSGKQEDSNVLTSEYNLFEMCGYLSIFIGLLIVFLFHREIGEFGYKLLDPKEKWLQKNTSLSIVVFDENEPVKIKGINVMFTFKGMSVLFIICQFFALPNSILNNYRRCKQHNICDYQDYFLFPLTGLIHFLHSITISIPIAILIYSISKFEIQNTYAMFLMLFLIPAFYSEISVVRDEIRRYKKYE